MSSAITDQLATTMEKPLARLVAFEPTTLPVVSVYLNTQSDQHGRTPDAAPYLHREFKALARTWAPAFTPAPNLICIILPVSMSNTPATPMNCSSAARSKTAIPCRRKCEPFSRRNSPIQREELPVKSRGKRPCPISW